MKKITPTHPGEILSEEFLMPLKITPYRLAKDISVPQIRISEIIHKKRAISADTALRLAKYFSTSPQFWANLQSRHDLEIQKDKLANVLKKEVIIHTPAKTKTSMKSTPIFARQ